VKKARELFQSSKDVDAERGGANKGHQAGSVARERDVRLIMRGIVKATLGGRKGKRGTGDVR